MRLKPRYNENVNKWWMCDEGRYGYKFADQNRIETPSKRTTPVPGTLRDRFAEPVPAVPGTVQEMHWETIIPEIASVLQLTKGKIAVFLSPQLSNEDLFAARKLFSEHLKIQDLFLVNPNPDGYQDDFLIRADKNPNSIGAKQIGFWYDDGAVNHFYTRCEQGEFEGIVVFGQDLLSLNPARAKAAFDKLKWSLFIGTNHNLMSEYASYVLPSAVHFEKDGTFTNFEGRVQRFDRALDPLGESRPAWRILINIARQLGHHMHFDRAEEVFHELALSVEAFKGLEYEKLNTGAEDIRVLAEPMIPSLVQNSHLIFHDIKPEQAAK